MPNGSAIPWNLTFKDDKWHQALAKIIAGGMSPPVAKFVGHRLGAICSGSSTSGYLALLTSDWTGDVPYLKWQFFASLREHTYDAKAYEVTFKNSKLVLNVRDAITSEDEGDIEMDHPGKLFHYHKKELQTAVLHYSSTNLIRIGLEGIGGVDADSPKSRKNKRLVKNICSLRLHFGDGKPGYRIIKKRGADIGLVPKRTRDENGRQWITSWKSAR